jgi:hypothetical protein
MPLRRLIVAVILAAGEAFCCTEHMPNPDDLVKNEVKQSANGRFTVVVREYPQIADFKSERAGKVFGMDDAWTRDEPVPETPPSTVIAALYGEGRKRIAEIPVDREMIGDVLVSDSGRTIVVVRGLGGFCSAPSTAVDPFLTVYRADGIRVGTLKAGDIFDPHDLERLSFFDVKWEMRAESDEREVVVLSVNDREIRIDAATATMLGPKPALYPIPRTAGPSRPSARSASFRYILRLPPEGGGLPA